MNNPDALLDANLGVLNLLSLSGYDATTLLQAVEQLDNLASPFPVTVIIRASSGASYSVRIRPPTADGRLPDHTAYLELKVQQLIEANDAIKDAADTNMWGASQLYQDGIKLRAAFSAELDAMFDAMEKLDTVQAAFHLERLRGLAETPPPVKLVEAEVTVAKITPSFMGPTGSAHFDDVSPRSFAPDGESRPVNREPAEVINLEERRAD